MTNACVLHHREPQTPTPNTLICQGHHRWLTHTLEDIQQTTAPRTP